MKRFRDLPIRQKLVAIIMLTSTITLLLASMAFLSYELITFRKGMVQELSTLASIIGNNSAEALNTQDQQVAQNTLTVLKSEPHIISACIYRATGKIFALYIRQNGSSCAEMPENDQYIFSADHLTLPYQIITGGKELGMVVLQADLQEMYSRLGRYASIGLLVILVSLLIAFFLSSKLQEVISRPITHLAEIAGMVSSKKNYAIRADADNHDELGLLVTRFNEMLAQVQKRDVEIQTAHDELEKRVTERTEALQEEVNERKRSEIALRESQERYALSMRGANDGLWDWDLTHNTLYFSPR